MNSLARLAIEPQMTAQREKLVAMVSRLLDEAITIQQIPAPTFDEGRRAAYVLNRFQDLQDVEIDSLNNVYGRLPGKDPHLAAVLLAAHTDTVFEIHTPLDIQRQGKRIYGPGLGDNSLGVAALLAIKDILCAQHLPADIWFVANVREEGLGDLGGIRAAYEKLGPRLGLAMIIEGIALGRIYHAGIAVRRLKITCRTPGGHSWLHFGRPSAIHGLMRLGAQITMIQPPISPRTTYNIGVIEGGRSVNSIAANASLLLDMRSEDPEMLATLERQIRAMVDSCRAPEMEFEVKVVGDRPAGSIPISHPLVQAACQASELAGIQPVLESGSTDANALLAAGLPTVTVGVAHGGNAHRTDEYIETASTLDGMWQLLLLATAMATGRIAQNHYPL